MATTIDPNLTYICDQSFASPVGDVQRNVKLRGDDVCVTTYPMFFSEFGTPDTERGSEWKTLNEKQEAEEAELAADAAAARARQAARNRVKLQVPPILRATQDIVTEIDGRPATVSKGSTVLADDLLVASFPDLFEAAK